CWLGYGDRAEFGLAMNELVKRGEIKAPIVIGRDHLDSGSVASPNRETEGMLDGSDAIADWPLLNALVNTAAGASWISIHNGGGTSYNNTARGGVFGLVFTPPRGGGARPAGHENTTENRAPPPPRPPRPPPPPPPSPPLPPPRGPPPKKKASPPNAAGGGI